jgi:hypothetical protein
MTNQTNTPYDIGERSLEFAAQVAKVVNNLSHSVVSSEYGKQLIRSASSVGAKESQELTLILSAIINKTKSK